jgi:POT family proton-dependent oligopeptide transporter
MFGGEFDDAAITANPQLLVDLFGVMVKWLVGAAILVFIISKPLKKLMGNIQ